MVEQVIRNDEVRGSIPRSGTIETGHSVLLNVLSVLDSPPSPPVGGRGRYWTRMVRNLLKSLNILRNRD